MRSTVDVVIIGGGCMGASVAYFLTRLGITNIVLLERDSLLGTGSTGRNAGGVRHQFSQKANVLLSLESIRFFELFEEETGAALDFRQDGYLFLLSTEQAFARFKLGASMQRALGVPVEILSPKEAAKLAPGLDVDGVIGATFCQRDGIADPHGVTQGFAKAAQRLGATVTTQVEVIDIVTEGGAIREVITSTGSIATPVVVNAAGPWARSIGTMAGIEIPVEPYRRHIYLASLPDSSIAAGRSVPWPSSQIMVVDFDTTFYFHREGTGLLFGMGDVDETPTFDQSVESEFIEKVIPVATRRLPALIDASISHSWAGLYEMTPDAMPIIGPSPQLRGFFTINGFSGHGFQHAPAAGRILADLIAGRDPAFDRRPFSIGRFEEGDATPESNVV